jgi:CspA family cold shock protein
MELISINKELQESVRQMHNHNWKVEPAQHEGDIILYSISPGSIRSGLPQVLEQWSETAHLVVSDFRASNEVNSPANNDVFLSEAHLDFSISVSLSESETDVCVFVEKGHIMGDSLPNRSEVTEVAGKENSRNFAAHKKLSYISFLYIVSEEFIESLDGYESANPYSEKLEGTVKFFHDRKGYGFIEREKSSESDDDVFFHMEDIGGPDLEEGEGVRFDVTEGEKGPRAKDVERI